MPSLRKFDAGLFSMGPADQSPPGTMRRGKGIAKLNQDSIRSRWGIEKLVGGTTAVRATVRYNGERYYQQFNSVYAPDDTELIAGIGSSLNAIPFLIAPVGPAKPDYLFIATSMGMKKIGPDGVASDWGITAFADNVVSIALGTPATLTIDMCEDISSYNASGHKYTNTTVALRSGVGQFIEGSNSIEIGTSDTTITGAAYYAHRTLSGDLDLTAFTSPSRPSPNEDYISLWVYTNDPNSVEYIILGFSLHAAYDTTTHEAADEYVHIIRLNAATKTSDQEIGITAQKSRKSQRDLVNESTTTSLTLDQLPPDNDPNTLDDLRQEIIDGSVIDIKPTALQWFQVKVPKDAFSRVGTGAYTWANVRGIKLGFKSVKGAPSVPYVRFDKIQLYGSYGTRGTYHAYITALNSTTGNESQPNPTVMEVKDVDRMPFTWTLPTTAPLNSDGVPDPQVDKVRLYRTLGDGGLFFKVADVALSAGTYTDEVADFPGMLSGTSVTYLSNFELSFFNIKPEGTYADAVGPHLGRIWFCRDVTEGRGSRVYYTRSGYVEGIQGFVSVGTDDEATQKLVIWNRNLYCFTKRGIFQIAGLTEPFIPLQIKDVPGTSKPFSVQPTPFGIVYEAEDGFRVFTGQNSTLTASIPISALFQGEDLEGIPAWQGTFSSAAGLDYYYCTDNATVLCLDSQGRWRHVFQATTATLSGAHNIWGLNFEVATGLFIVGTDVSYGILESEGTLVDDVNAIATRPIEIEWEPPHIRLADPNQTCILRRVHLDINCNGNQLVPTLILDGTEVELAPITNSTRGMIELARNTPCRLLGIRLTGEITTQVEWFGVDPDVWIADSSR